MVFLLVLIPLVWGHGRLMTPISRVGHQFYENDPTGSSANGGNNNDAWVCRHGTPTVPTTTLTAGQTTTLTWFFGAKHVGDCDVYLSYDVNRPRPTMRWFKIANYFDCRLQSNQEPQQLTIPSWVPNGKAVLRWGWYALHQVTSIEFYSQCADVMISNPNVSNLPSNIVTYPLINPPLFPLDSQQGQYPNRFGSAATNSWMVGPPCAGDLANSQVNQCYRTAPGTQGYIDIGSNPGPTVTTTQSSQPTSNCPEQCSTCQSGGADDGGVAIQNGRCRDYCSQYGFCGASSAYQNGGTDCSGCPPVVTTNTASPTTTTVDTASGTISNRCGTNWVHATSHCGTECVLSDSVCPTGQLCFAGMTLACPTDFYISLENVAPLQENVDIPLLTCANGWELIQEATHVPANYCETTCSNDLCDQDLCRCTLTGNFATNLLVSFALVFGILQF